MLRITNTSFFLFRQNNAYGYFIRNEDVDIFICVEASGSDLEDVRERTYKAIGENGSHSCSRWAIESTAYYSPVSEDQRFEAESEEELKVKLQEWLNSLDKWEKSDKPACIVHFWDGHKTKIEL